MGLSGVTVTVSHIMTFSKHVKFKFTLYQPTELFIIQRKASEYYRRKVNPY